jgi:uncharacterized membrane protein YqjE
MEVSHWKPICSKCVIRAGTKFGRKVEIMLSSSDNKQDKSVGELFSDLTREMSTLVRQEVQLAKTEMTHKAASFGKNLGFVVVAAIFALLALQALCAAAILGLAQVLAPWLAALIVGGVLLVVAAILTLVAMKAIKKEGLAPTQTVETIQEDVQWAKQQMN